MEMRCFLVLLSIAALGETLLKSWPHAEAKLGGAADHTEIFRVLEG
jgi:hypothetical protein